MEPMSTRTSPARRPDAAAISAALLALASGSRRREDLAALSDLTRAEAAGLDVTWGSLDELQRVAALRALAEGAEERLEFNFGRLLRRALDDPSPVVRQLAVTGLWEDDRSDLLLRLLDLAENDPSQDVQAEAAQNLGRFADRAATGELPSETASMLRQALISLAANPAFPLGVRRRALESVAVFCEDPGVKDLISTAYHGDEQSLRASALYAMGRNLDDRWLPTVLDELASDEAELRYEAARAAGELGDDAAVPALADLTDDPDIEVRDASISALGKIGGRAAVRVLRALADQADGSVLDAIEAALDEAQGADSPSRSPA